MLSQRKPDVNCSFESTINKREPRSDSFNDSNLILQRDVRKQIADNEKLCIPYPFVRTGNLYSNIQVLICKIYYFGYVLNRKKGTLWLHSFWPRSAIKGCAQIWVETQIWCKPTFRGLDKSKPKSKSHVDLTRIWDLIQIWLRFDTYKDLGTINWVMRSIYRAINLTPLVGELLGKKCEKNGGDYCALGKKRRG